MSKKNPKKKSHKILWTLIIVFALFIGFGISGNNSSETQEDKVTKSSSSKKSSSTSNKKSKEKVKTEKINTAIAKRLSENQSYAQQGSSTSFEYSKYLNKVVYDKDDGLTVYVTEPFLYLNNYNKTQVANSAQTMALSVLLEEEVIDNDEYREGLFTVVNLDNTQLGTTRILDKNEFKWNKNSNPNTYQG